ncbi:MAG: CRP-like cAMP-binding protein [Pseudorhodobacter sp.]|jgi:CRP-like cAMP-binding protein
MRITPLIRKLGAFGTLSGTELALLEALHKRRRSFVAGRDLVHQGQSDHAAYILVDGWACSYKILPDGERQIVDFQIPGDFLGLRSVLLNVSDHSIEPITDIEVSEVLITDLLDAFALTPRLATGVLWAASRDEAMVVEHLVNVGRRNAIQRMAHFLLELGARLALVGMGSKAGYACPLTQYLMADALGLSAVHVNRVLRQLREDGLVTFRDGHVTFDDYDGLIEFTGFELDYLDEPRPPVADMAAWGRRPQIRPSSITTAKTIRAVPSTPVAA